MNCVLNVCLTAPEGTDPLQAFACLADHIVMVASSKKKEAQTVPTKMLRIFWSRTVCTMLSWLSSSSKKTENRTKITPEVIKSISAIILGVLTTKFLGGATSVAPARDVLHKLVDLLEPVITEDCSDEIVQASVGVSSKFFLQHLQIFLKNPGFDQVWMRFFRLFMILITNSKRDSRLKKNFLKKIFG